MTLFRKSYIKKQLNATPKQLYILINNKNLNNTDSIYYSNRAVAYKLISRLTEAKQDAEYAIKLDVKNSRALFILGTLILLEA